MLSKFEVRFGALVFWDTFRRGAEGLHWSARREHLNVRRVQTSRDSKRRCIMPPYWFNEIWTIRPIYNRNLKIFRCRSRWKRQRLRLFSLKIHISVIKWNIKFNSSSSIAKQYHVHAGGGYVLVPNLHCETKWQPPAGGWHDSLTPLQSAREKKNNYWGIKNKLCNNVWPFNWNCVEL